MKFPVVRHRGESLLEVMVAVVLLSSILISTFNILQRAVSTNTSVRNQVIALNIAREGMEGVRNIRDTNWLKYSGDRRGKWLCLDSIATPDACSTGTPTLINGNRYYTLDYSGGRYYLTQVASGSVLDVSTNLSAQSNYLINDNGTRFTHGSGTSTGFYRQIQLEVANPYEDETPPNFCDTDDGDCDNARLKVTVRVQWLEEGNLRQSNLEGHLFDFFERDSY